MIIEAKLKNEILPDINLNLPPGFLEVKFKYNRPSLVLGVKYQQIVKAQR